MDLDWSPISNQAWRGLLDDAPRANLLQSWAHAVAARRHDQMMTRRARIMDGARHLGIVQIQEAGIGPFHVLRLHRGPLWFDRADTPAHWLGFFAALNRTYPPRLGRWRHFLPELDDAPEARQLLQAAGLRRRKASAYQTLMLDLREPANRLRARLKSGWRHTLKRAEAADFEVCCDIDARSASAFLTGYAEDKRTKGYRGPRPARLATMMAAAAPHGDVLIMNASRHGQTIAAMLFFRHGKGATYQAGWTTAAGRTLGAHHRLLWSAMLRLKADGVGTLDLGGIHPDMAEGVTRFKKGLGGAPMSLVGLYG